jgi:hypothetical protein
MDPVPDPGGMRIWILNIAKKNVWETSCFEALQRGLRIKILNFSLEKIKIPYLNFIDFPSSKTWIWIGILIRIR